MASLRNLEGRRQLFSEFEKQYPGRLDLIELDVCSDAQREALVTNLTRRKVELYGLVNNAGFGQFGSILDLSRSDIQQQFDVNFFGTLQLTQALIPFLTHDSARILNISSVLGFTTMPLSGAYAASKHALEGYFEASRLELRKLGLQVCLIEPGAFDTQFNSRLQWGSQPDPLFESERSAFNRFREKRRESKKNGKPQVVVDEILRLMKLRRIPFRKRIGRDAAAAYWARRLLPQSLYLRLSDMVFSSVLRQK